MMYLRRLDASGGLTEDQLIEEYEDRMREQERDELEAQAEATIRELLNTRGAEFVCAALSDWCKAERSTDWDHTRIRVAADALLLGTEGNPWTAIAEALKIVGKSLARQRDEGRGAA